MDLLCRSFLNIVDISVNDNVANSNMAHITAYKLDADVINRARKLLNKTCS